MVQEWLSDVQDVWFGDEIDNQRWFSLDFLRNTTFTYVLNNELNDEFK